MHFAFPNTIYDQPANLLAVLGSWWADMYAGRDQVLAVVQGKCQIENQSMLDLMGLIASISRFSVPIYHTANWYPLYIRASERNDSQTSLLKYDTDGVYDGTKQYDVPKTSQFHAFPCPADLVAAPLLMNRFVAPTLLQSENIDYVLDNGAIVFRKNPFEDPRVATRVVYTDGVPTDTEALLWIFNGQFDWDQIYKQFGYVIGLRLKSSTGYRDLMNAIYDAMVGGTTAGDMFKALSAMTGIPVVREASEVIVDIQSDTQNLLIITDLSVYKFHLDATPVVAIGDTVLRWQPLTDALRFHELNCGVTPPDLLALSLGRGFLATCFYADLIFENRDVPLVVDTADPSGYTKLSWDLGGFPLDVTQFFDELHARGVAEAQRPIDPCETVRTVRYPVNDCDEEEVIRRRGTLAHLLDKRTDPVGEPVASQLPATINPLQFLVANVLRNNAFIVRIKVAALGANGVGLHNIRLLHKVMPPHTAMIMIVDLTAPAELVTVEQLSEHLTTFVGTTPLKDVVNSAYDRRLTVRVVSGTCQ